MSKPIDPLERAWKEHEEQLADTPTNQEAADRYDIERGLQPGRGPLLSQQARVVLPSGARIAKLDGCRGPMLFFSKEQEEEIAAARERAAEARLAEFVSTPASARRTLFCEPSAMADAEPVRQTASDVIDFLAATSDAREHRSEVRQAMFESFVGERRLERDCAQVMHL